MGITNPFQMVVLIVLITAVASVVRARYGMPSRRRERIDERVQRDLARHGIVMPPQDSAETEALRAELKALKDRVAVLERLATDGSSALEREFEKLRRED